MRALRPYSIPLVRSSATLHTPQEMVQEPIEELIEVGERSASAPVYPLLERPDERYVTMQAHDNPTFVEDVVRNVAVRLREDDRIVWFLLYAPGTRRVFTTTARSPASSGRGRWIARATHRKSPAT